LGGVGAQKEVNLFKKSNVSKTSGFCKEIKGENGEDFSYGFTRMILKKVHELHEFPRIMGPATAGILVCSIALRSKNTASHLHLEITNNWKKLTQSALLGITLRQEKRQYLLVFVWLPFTVSYGLGLLEFSPSGQHRQSIL